MILLAGTNCLCFWIIGVLSEGKCSSYSQVWEITIGRSTRIIPTLAVAINGTITCVSYAVGAGNMLAKSLSPGFNLISFPEIESVRKIPVVIAFMSTIVFPLTLLTDLAPLKYPSFAGLAATAIALVIVILDSF